MYMCMYTCVHTCTAVQDNMYSCTCCIHVHRACTCTWTWTWAHAHVHVHVHVHVHICAWTCTCTWTCTCNMYMHMYYSLILRRRKWTARKTWTCTSGARTGRFRGSIYRSLAMPYRPAALKLIVQDDILDAQVTFLVASQQNWLAQSIYICASVILTRRKKCDQQVDNLNLQTKVGTANRNSQLTDQTRSRRS